MEIGGGWSWLGEWLWETRWMDRKWDMRLARVVSDGSLGCTIVCLRRPSTVQVLVLCGRQDTISANLLYASRSNVIFWQLNQCRKGKADG